MVDAVGASVLGAAQRPAVTEQQPEPFAKLTEAWQKMAADVAAGWQTAVQARQPMITVRPRTTWFGPLWSDKVWLMAKKVTLAQAREVLNSDELFCDVEVLAVIVGMAPWSYYEAVKRGDAPVMPILIGRRQRYRISDVRAFAGLPSLT